MAGQVNVQFVYGAGNDNWYGGGIRDLRAAVISRFGSRVYCPDIIDYTAYSTLVGRLQSWNDPTVLVGHSCGCMSITRAAEQVTAEQVPYLMAIAPSIYCRVAPMETNVKRATQATSWWGDFFNPGARMLLSKSRGNNVTQLDQIVTGMGHVQAPYSPAVKSRLLSEIDTALAAVA